jgi:hypothetical protein
MRKLLTWEKFDQKTTELEPGMLLKVREETDLPKKKTKAQLIRVYLVGDVNRNLGVCDDCTNFEKADILEYSTDYVDILGEHMGLRS